MHELDKDGCGSVSMDEFVETIENFDANGVEEGDDIIDGPDELDEYGGQFGVDPDELLHDALDD